LYQLTLKIIFHLFRRELAAECVKSCREIGRRHIFMPLRNMRLRIPSVHVHAIIRQSKGIVFANIELLRRRRGASPACAFVLHHPKRSMPTRTRPDLEARFAIAVFECLISKSTPLILLKILECRNIRSIIRMQTNKITCTFYCASPTGFSCFAKAG